MITNYHYPNPGVYQPLNTWSLAICCLCLLLNMLNAYEITVFMVNLYLVNVKSVSKLMLCLKAEKTYSIHQMVFLYVWLFIWHKYVPSYSTHQQSLATGLCQHYMFIEMDRREIETPLFIYWHLRILVTDVSDRLQQPYGTIFLSELGSVKNLQEEGEDISLYFS